MIEPSGLWTPNKFHIKKYSERIIPCSGHVGLGGWFRLEVVNEDGRSHWLTDWFHNNITNIGLDMCATNTSRYNCCQVGTGNAAPTDADTTLQTFLAGKAGKTVLSRTNSGNPTYYTENYFRYDFATGAVVGNISEVGIGPSASSGTNLFSRELIRDASGNPTTVTIASNEALRVHYKLRIYPPVSDVTGNVSGTIEGAGASRGFTRRAAAVDDVNRWATDTTLFGSAGSYSQDMRVYTGGIGVITGSPGGTPYNKTSLSAGAYSNGSYSRTKIGTFSTGTANANLKSVSFYNATFESAYSAGWFQVEFDTTLNKTDLQELTIECLISWGRYTP